MAQKFPGLSKAAQKSVVIVGAGISGLSAARFLSDNTDLKVTVLEANADRYGGRIWTYEAPGYPGKPVELGGMWLHGGENKEQPIRQFCDSHGLKTQKHDAGDPAMVLAFDSRGKKLSSLDVETIWAIDESVSELADSAGKTDIPLSEALKHEKDARLKEVLDSALGKQIVIPAIEALNGGKTQQLSTVLYEGTPDSDTKVDYGTGDRIIVDGCNKVLDTLLKEPRKFQLKLGISVTTIHYRDPSLIEVEAYLTKNGSEKVTIVADIVIVAVPLGVLQSGSIAFQPELPISHRTAIARTGFGNMVKVLLIFDSAFWPDVEVIFTATENPSGFPLDFVNLHKIHGMPALLAFLPGEAADKADRMSENQILPKVLSALEKIVGRSAMKAHTLRQMKVTRWRSDPLFRGAYSFAKFGQTIEDTYNIREPVDSRIYFAGEHTTFPEHQFGTIHGAYTSGIRAAKEIMGTLGLSTASKLGFSTVLACSSCLLLVQLLIVK